MNIRLDKTRNKLDELKLEAFLITDGINMRYVSGFSGSAGMLLITQKEAVLFTDSRYLERADAEIEDVIVYRNKSEEKEKLKILDYLSLELERLGIKKLGFESDSVYYYFYQSLLDKFPSIEWVPVKRVVESIREIKSQDELDCIKEAAGIAEKAYLRTMEYLVPGVRECDIRAHLNYFIQTLGGFGESFEIIVASGPNGAIPHARTSERIIREGELIVIDFGATYKGYCSDCTRTVLLGEANKKQKFLYELVLKAQKAALGKIAPGVSCSEIDNAAREIFKAEGYAEEFTHSTGHAVGLLVHEKPGLSFISEYKLEAGMVITVEPGLYFSGWGGIRIEDMVVITVHGFELITHLPCELCKKF